MDAMARMKIQQGELAQWLQFVADGGAVARERVPEHLAEALLVLRCVRENDTGHLELTDKGRLALRMESPGAIHLG